MALGKSIYKSYVKEINNKLEKVQGERLVGAGRHIRKEMRKKASKRRRSTAGQPAGRVSNNLRKGMAIKKVRNDLVIVGYSAPAYHAHLVELGTTDRVRKDGKKTGKVLPRPIIVPTFKEQAGAVENILNKTWI